MKKLGFLLVFASLFCFGLLALSSLSAAELEPVAAVSVASYDTIDSSVKSVLEIAGVEDLYAALNMSFGGIDGLDKSRPSGLILFNDGTQFVHFLFLPVASLDDLMLPGLENADEVKEKLNFDEEANTISLSGDDDNIVKLIERDGWLYLVPEEFEASFPAELDPVKLLNGLNEKYLFGVSVRPGDVPEELIDAAMAPIRVAAAQEESIIQSFDVLQNAVDYLKASCESLEVGLSVDQTSGDIALSIEVVPVPGSDYEANMAKNISVTTLWSDFYRPEDAVIAGMNTRFLDSGSIDLQKANLNSSIDKVVKTLDESIAGIEESEDEDDDHAANEKNAAVLKGLKQFLEDLRQWALVNVERGSNDAAFSMLKDGSIISASTISKGEDLNACIKNFVEIMKNRFADDDNTGIRNFVSGIKTKENAFEGYTVTTFVVPKSFVDEVLPGLTVKPGYSFLIAVKDDSSIFIAGPNQKKVAELFKEKASMKRTSAPSAQKWLISIPNLASFLLNIQTISTNEGIAPIIKTVADGDVNAAIVAGSAVTNSSESGQVAVKGELVKLIGQTFLSVKDTAAEDDGEEGEAETDEELFK